MEYNFFVYKPRASKVDFLEFKACNNAAWQSFHNRELILIVQTFTFGADQFLTTCKHLLIRRNFAPYNSITDEYWSEK
jgi:hypothetical protein